MPNLNLNLTSLMDDTLKDNFQQIQDFLNKLQTSHNQIQVAEIFVPSNQSGIKISHSLGGVPVDAFISKLIAPSAARLTAKFSEFTKNEIVFDVTGLAAGESLFARIVFGTFPDAIRVGSGTAADPEVQEFRGKF